MSDQRTNPTIAVSEVVAERLSPICCAENLTTEEAAEMCLLAGLEFFERRRLDRLEGLERIARDLEEIRTCLHVLGPAALGTNLLLTYWATTTGSLKVTEEELTNEYKAASQMEWALEMTKRGIVPFLAEGNERERPSTGTTE